MNAQRAGRRAHCGWVLLVGMAFFAPPWCLGGSDFNGDGRDDIVTFLRSSRTGDAVGDVYVGLSTGSAFGAGRKWHNIFSIDLEIPATGDFNGDGRDDVITFVRDTQGEPGRGDVIVSLSNGSSFDTAYKWHEFFCVGTEIPVVGDFNGDGRDDIATFVRSTASGAGQGDVYVALSNGTSFGAGTKWHEWFGLGDEIPLVGDFNGDGRDDIAVLLRSTVTDSGQGDVYVALSTGSAFGPSQKWHDYFCLGNEIPGVGDFNGDGRDDLVTFVRDAWPGASQGDVFVALSTGSAFSGTAVRWHSFFCVGNEIPMVGDFTGDGKADIATFIHETTSGTGRGDVYVATSTGTAFGPGRLWNGYFCLGDEVPTSQAALFPQFLFSKSYEDNDAEFVGYVSNEEGRFVGFVTDFKDQFASSWPCSQYLWGERRFMQEDHLYHVDSADLAYVAGHGSAAYMAMSSGQDCDLTQCAWGSWSSKSRKGDLEYIAFHSCSVLSLNGDWRARWASTPNRRRPFAGLHVACGFKDIHRGSPTFDLGEEFAENLQDGYSVRWAWLEATDDENDQVWGHDNLGCVIYVNPHKDETASGRGSRDRWYHDSDYVLNASYWTY